MSSTSEARERVGAPKKVILTGVTGFIGSHLAEFLSASGFEIYSLSRRLSGSPVTQEFVCSLTDEKTLAEIMESVRPDYLLHVAAWAQPGRDFALLEEHYENTVLPTVALARTMPETLTLALFFGSCEEYGNALPPFQEDQALHCFSPYGWAKIAAHYAATTIARQRNIPACWVRPFLTFGPRQKGNSLIPFLIAGCLSDTEVPLTPGEQTRDFIYVQDLCRMVRAILDRPDAAKGQAINLCSGTERTVREVGERIVQAVGGGKLRFGALPYRKDEAMSFYGSREKFDALFGPVALTPFAEAIRATVESYTNR